MTKCKHESICFYDGKTTYHGRTTTVIPKNAHFCDDCEKILEVKVKQ